MSPEKIIGYARDAGCVVVGLGGIIRMLVTGEPDGQLLSTCLALLSIAGGIRVWQLRPGSNTPGGGRSSSSARSGSRSPSGSSSAEGEP